MAGAELHSGREFRSWTFWFEIRIALTALPPTLLYVLPVVRFPREQLTELAAAIAIAFAAGGALALLAFQRKTAPVAAYLDAAPGTAPPAVREAAFAALMDLPRYAFVTGCALWWTLGSALVLYFGWRFDAVSDVTLISICTGAFAAGLVSQSFAYLALKARLEPLRERIAAEIPDSEVRGRLVRRISLSRKLLVPVTGLILVNLVFGLSLAHIAAARRAGDHGRLMVEAALDAVGRRVAAGEPLAAALAAGRATSETIALREVGALDLLKEFGVAALISMLIGVLLTYLGAREVSRGAKALGAEVGRVAAGDLRAGRAFESEDEFGDLARAFGRMSLSLRTAVERIGKTADRVEGASEAIAEASQSVADVSRQQIGGLERAAATMEGIHGRVDGVAGFAHSLSTSMEASSSSLAMLLSGGDSLRETAATLTTRAGEVGQAIEKTVQSIEHVAGRADHATTHAESASQSVEQMLDTMMQVDAAAKETAELAEGVVATADRGREHVRQTLTGMRSIREATEEAQGVIGSLGERAGEIGEIVDVINSVAEQTNLLALNASIIAAQAGEHGQAFAVVAREVQALADRVLRSTGDIAGVVGGLQRETERAMQAIESGAKRVHDGVGLAAGAEASLEEITTAARESGSRIAEIVAAIRSQTRANSAVVEMLVEVRNGVQEIRSLGQSQVESSNTVRSSAEAMESVATVVRRTVEEQFRSVRLLHDGVDRVEEVTRQIHAALEEQSRESASAADLLAGVTAETRSNEAATTTMERAVETLEKHAQELRRDLRGFRT